MQLTKGAIGNLINRYRAVLKKCHLMNVFGSLAVAGMLVMGGAGAAGAAEVSPNALLSYTGSEFIKNTDAVADDGTFDYTTEDKTISITATGQKSSGRGVLTNLYNEGTSEKVSTSGLTITNSTFTQNSQSVTGAGGGAVSLWGDGNEGIDPLTHSITGTTFIGNTATLGGAVAIMKQNAFDVAGNTTFVDDTFTGNNAVNGGAIYAENEDITVSGNSSFEGNTASQNGGAIYILEGSTLTVEEGTTFSKNTANTNGGAIAGTWGDNSSLTVTGSYFTENAARSGGAIALWNPTTDATYTVSNTVFNGNTATKKGGAIAILSETGVGGQVFAKTEATFNGDEFTGNTAGESGGALHLEYANVTITDSTFTANEAGQQGGAIYNAADSSITFTGTNTFSGNMAAGEANDIYNLGNITVKDGTTSLGGGLTLAGGTVNVADNGTLAGTVTWQNGSVDANKGLIVIDKKGNASLNGGMNTGDGASASVDLVTTEDGKVTLQGITADKNTFAFNSYPYKNVGVVTFGLGNENAAVDVTVSGSKFTNNTVTATTNNTDKRSQSTAGGAAISFDANDSTMQSTLTISGSTFDSNTFEVKGDYKLGGAYGGAIGVQDRVAVILKDVTLTHNAAIGDGMNAQGGGYYQSAYEDKEASLDATDLTVTGNTAQGKSAYGGGMALFGVKDGATIKNSTFSDNTASGTEQSMGGALFTGETGGQISVTTVTNSTFTNNKAEGTYGWGGAIYNAGDLTVDNTTFENNVASAQGGAIYVHPKAKLDVTNSYFKGNTGTAGGAIAMFGDNGATPEHSISNTVFEGNIADRTGDKLGKGGAIAILKMDKPNPEYTTNLDLSGVTFIDNESNGTGGAIHSESATLTITDATFSGNSAGQKGGAIYNDADSSITFTGTNTFSGNNAAEGKDIYNEGNITFDGTNTQMDGGMVMANGTMEVTNSQVSMAELAAEGGSITAKGSELTVGQLKNNTLGSSLTVGTDGIVNIGNLDSAKLAEAMNDAGMGAGSAILALNTSMNMEGYTRLVVGTDDSENAGAVFGKDSLLVVDANGVTDDQVIHAGKDEGANKTAFIHSQAQLRIINAKAGEYVTVLNGFGSITDENGILEAGWTNEDGVENLDYMLSSYATIMEGRDGQPDVVVVSELNAPTEALPGIDPDLAPVLLSVWDNGLNDVDSPDMGVRFLSRAVRADYINGDAAKSAATIESAARIAFAGAVPQMTKMASDAATNAVVNRLGFANPVDGAQAINAEGQIVDRNTTGFALWIAPLWQSQHGWGMEAGNLDYGFNGNLGGISLGADYTFENAIRAGITFNIGGGYAETSGGDLNSTENRMTFWGLGAYAGWNYENFGLMADVSYTSTWNQLEQDLDPGMGMGDLEADVQATAISAGLRAEYKLETSVLDIIPHVGVRYMSLNTWGYDVDANGGTVMEGDGFHQDIWTFPVGVTFSKDITLDSGWFFKPSVDFSVIPAAGDIKAREDVRFTGAPVVAEMETQMMDYLTWQGGVGVQLGNDNLSFGVNYTLQAGQNTTGHGVFGNFRYEF